MEPKIHFIGISHADPYGQRKLERALLVESPDILTIEGSDEMDEYVKSGEHQRNAIIRLDRYREKGLSKRAYELFVREVRRTYGYENKIAKKYSESKGIQLHNVDDLNTIEEARNHFLVDELGEVEPMNKKTFEDLVRHAEKGYEDFEKMFTFPKVYRDSIDQIASKEARDENMAKNIERLLVPGKKLVHITGLLHCLDDSRGKSTFSRLLKYKPTRSTLGNKRYKL